MGRPWRLHATSGSEPACVRFTAMASPCEVWIDGTDATVLSGLADLAWHEAHRIETQWSRYRPDNLIHRINTANGAAVEVDPETARLLDYGAMLFEVSEGAFDLTSGVLRRAWRFDGGSRLPDPEQVRKLLQQVGWHRVRWQAPWLQMPSGMEIDLGGIGKEYAVDQTLARLQAHTTASILVNFGGDLAANRPRRDGQPWRVGIAEGAAPGAAGPLIRLERGGIATSGDTHRFVCVDGIRYGHVLDARSGWPAVGAPQSVTVAAQTCSEAGSLSTLAMLSGTQAEHFLQGQGVDFHVVRAGAGPAD